MQRRTHTLVGCGAVWATRFANRRVARISMRANGKGLRGLALLRGKAPYRVATC